MGQLGTAGDASSALGRIRDLVKAGRFDEAWSGLVPELLGADSARSANLARNVLRAGAAAGWRPPTERSIRLAVLSSYEVAEFRERLELACLALRVHADIYAPPYGQIEQELMGQGDLTAFAPSHVLLAPVTQDLGFSELDEDGDQVLDAAVARWTALWDHARSGLGARVVQHGFVVPEDTALGHVSMRVPGSRVARVREVNRRLAQAAGADVLLVDTERLAAQMGKQRWIDPRLWYATRQPFGYEASAALAIETAAVLEGDVGLAPRCLVVDLDNTLWGGLVGEEGALGVQIGDGPDGEAYAAFQDHVRNLGRRGVVLAVASKNDAEAAREPFESNHAMRLSLGDFAAFVADWRPKSEQISEIAQTLGLGLDALVFADDNPAECAEVASALPQVRTVCLEGPPSERVRLLAGRARFETPWLSRDDLERQRSYASRAAAVELQNRAASLDEFWRSLQMRARVAPLTSATLDRAAQLTQKTNQFNLTLTRRGREEIERLAAQDGAICMTLELEDRFARHGLIGLGFARRSDDEPETALIDTLLLSCRVIGRTAETHLVGHIAHEARALGYARLRGVYVPGPRNGLVADLYPKLGFVRTEDDGHSWEFDLTRGEPIESLYIADQP